MLPVACPSPKTNSTTRAVSKRAVLDGRTRAHIFRVSGVTGLARIRGVEVHTAHEQLHRPAARSALLSLQRDADTKLIVSRLARYADADTPICSDSGRITPALAPNKTGSTSTKPTQP